MNPYAALGLDVSLVLGEACLLFAACWFVARRLDNWSIVDVVWAYGFALIGLQKLGQHLVAGSLDGPGLLTALATVGWSLRLGTHLARRVLGHLDREDGRYLRMRAEHGDRMPRQMIGFYFLQAVALTLLCLPLLTESLFSFNCSLYSFSHLLPLFLQQSLGPDLLLLNQPLTFKLLCSMSALLCSKSFMFNPVLLLQLSLPLFLFLKSFLMGNNLLLLDCLKS